MSVTMPCGLFGKLPARRDFVAVASGREFLALWEAWMQSAVAASQGGLGERWQQAYLTAPIWRFWLGAELCGATTLGAIMPSLDGIGRYFPLTVFVQAPPGGAIAPPEFDPHIAFFAAAEEFLLSTLEEGVPFESTLAALAALRAPENHPRLMRRHGARSLSDGTLVLDAGEAPFTDVFASAREADQAAAYAATTFWWTPGGEGFPALALTKRRMPDPHVFAGMLSGHFTTVAE